MKKDQFRTMIKEIIKEVIEEMPKGVTPEEQYEDEGAMEEKKDKWIQKAIDPKHKGYCTPMTKKTCTPHRKALAMRFKKGDLSEEEINEAIEEFLQAEVAYMEDEAKQHSMYPKDDPIGPKDDPDSPVPKSGEEKIKSRQAAWKSWGEKMKQLRAIHDEPEFKRKLDILRKHGSMGKMD